MWWLVGGQEFFQLEVFHHTSPAQRPLPADWGPNALGWVRWGFTVDDFDAVLARLASTGLSLSAVMTVDGLRRICFRDPDFGVFVEVMENGPALGRSNSVDAHKPGPRVVYVTLSVPDLEVASAFYKNAVGLNPVAGELHKPPAEALWGLSGAQRQTLVLDGEGVLLELVQYTEPIGKRRPGLLLSDQGIMNIAVGWRERDSLLQALEQAVAGGGTLTAPLGDTAAVATYVIDPQGNSLEMLAMPADPAYEQAWGWVAKSQIFR
jgi:catechol 2,3-dioxygenase-like lactoylglutathione lyase family enzyme